MSAQESASIFNCLIHIHKVEICDRKDDYTSEFLVFYGILIEDLVDIFIPSKHFNS